MLQFIIVFIIVSQINLQWSFLPAFSCPHLQTFQVGKTFDEKAKG